MLIDLEDIESGTTLDCDLCIAGAGIVGITLARQFIGTDTRVCLLESGNTDFEPETQALYDGDQLGVEYYPLDDSRLRFFGGSTLVWGGRCVPLDRLDFERRSWVPHSGWPISRDDLDPFYRRAQDYLELGSSIHDERIWEELPVEPPAFDRRVLRTTFWQFDESHARFGRENCQDLATAENVRIVTHANVTKIQLRSDGEAVDHLDLATLGGRRCQVKSGRFVLATGGIENPRILLASNDVQPKGVGNQNDLVGRFFMEHPHGRAGEVLAKNRYRLLDAYRKRCNHSGLIVAPVLSPSDELQRSAGILNPSVGLKYRRRADLGVSMGGKMYSRVKHWSNPTTTGRRVWRSYKALKALSHKLTDSSVRRIGLARGSHRLYVSVRGEQAPNPDSRVVLSQKRDALGVPQADLDWHMSALDKQSVAVLIENLSKEMERLGLGHIEPSEWLATEETAWPNDPTVGTHPIGGYHHIGTTRMSGSPNEGVVDENAKVHGVRNLYVAGSSIFPTEGWANPNLTIVAMTLRLGDHLKCAGSR
jgi:choline dehydrogenase-like flavoprotein